MKKKLIFSALLFSGILISCGKSEIKTTTAATGSEDIALRTGGNGGNNGELMRIWYDDGNKPGLEGKTFGCMGIGGYCSKKNVLHAMHVPVIETIRTDGPAKYKSNFNLFHGELSEIFGSDLVDGVASGSMTLEIMGYVASEKNAYFIFGDGFETISVIPVGI